MAAESPAPTPASDAGDGAPLDRFTPPPWPWWCAPLGFVVAFLVGATLLDLLDAARELAGADSGKPPPAVNIARLLIQDLVLVAAAVAVAWLTARPQAWHFGLRRVPLRRAAAYALAGLVGFYAFTYLYTAVFEPQGKQSVAEDLGVNRGTAALVAGAVMVIVLAPIAEEIFFRGFFYRALRNGAVRLLGPVAGVLLAAAVDGAVFGALHFGGEKTLSLLPLLAVLGFVYCLVYEYTGSLFATIALHAVNTAVGYVAVAEGGVSVAVPLGLAMVAASILVPGLLGGARPADAPRQAAAAP